MTPVISVRHLAKQYRLGTVKSRTLSEVLSGGFRAREATAPSEFWALRDVSFDVQAGERLGIIGRNGAGKSTLLKILSRIVEPSSGEVRMRGRVASLLEVGTGFHPELSGRENIYLNGALLGMHRHEIRARFDEIVAFSEVEAFLDTPVKRYSSGMYVRLAFAVAAHLEPEILIVDEVLAVGDMEFQKKCLGKMQEVGREGRTVIFVSHQLAAVHQLCSSAILLNAGRVEAAGAVGDVVAEYLKRSNDLRSGANLATWEGRTGQGGVRFTWARLLGQDGQEKLHYTVGEPVTVEFGLEVTRTDFGNPVQVSVLLRSSDGTPLANMTDADGEFALPPGTGERTVRVTLPDLRFYPDRYFFSLWAGSDYADQTYDLVTDAVSFEVVSGGTLTPRRLTRQAGLVFLDSQWSTVPQTDTD